MFRLRTTIPAVLAFALLLVAQPGLAQIYRWVDGNGKMHFTQDLAQIPVAYRAAAKARADAPKKEIPIQTYNAPAPARIEGRSRAPKSTKRGRTHKIRVQGTGSSMRVSVRINGELDVPFIIDTGATGVVLPMWAAKQLELEVEGPGVRTSYVQTANGTVQVPVIMLESVKLGTARVENVSGIALDTMSEGLLGLAFFNHFTYNIEAASGLLTLTENNLAQEGVLRAGRSKSQWTGDFYRANLRIEVAEQQLSDAPSTHRREKEKRRSQLADAKNRLRLLENEADEARVPFSWRD